MMNKRNKLGRFNGTNISYFEENGNTTHIFPTVNLTKEYLTSIDILADKERIIEDVENEQYFYYILEAMYHVVKVKLLKISEYEKLWNSDNPRITRWYTEATKLEDLIKYNT